MKVQFEQGTKYSSFGSVINTLKEVPSERRRFDFSLVSGFEGSMREVCWEERRSAMALSWITGLSWDSFTWMLLIL